MTESALKLLIDGLEQSRAVLDSRLLFWTWLVVIGVALELIFVIWAYIDERRPWHIAQTRGIVPLPERPSRLKLICELIGIVFVVAGVAGELYVDKQSGRIETSLRDANEKRVLLLQQEAGAAKKSADGAADAATRARTDADAAGLKADAVSKKAEQIDAGLRETQWAFSMRNLSSLAERDKIVEQLKQFQGKTVFVRSYRYMGDVDGFRICKMVIDMAHSAGIKPVDQCSTLLPGEIPAAGIQVCGPTDDEMLSLSQTLARVDVGTTCPFGKVPHSADLVVNVGSKALGGVGETFQTEDAEGRAAAMKKKRKPRTKP